MKSRHLTTILTAALLGLGLSACAAPASPNASADPAVAHAQTAPTAAPAATTAPTTVATAEGTAAPLSQSGRGVTADGQIVPAQDASLLFSASGTVAQVLVHAGDTVQAGQVVAALDTQALDLAVSQAAAALASASAQLAGLTEAPRAASLASAQAQVQSAEAALAELKAGPKAQDVTSARASLAAAQASLETQRSSLSSAKTQAELAVEQAANTLRSAQDEYSRIYWQNRELEKFPGDLPQANKDSEAAAKRAVENAEQGLHQAQVAAESARQAEQTGVQAAQQQVTEAQASLDKLLAGATADQIASAAAQLAQARSQLDALTHPATASQQAQGQASVQQAQAALELAQFNRAQAELKAPFSGVVAEVNIDVGDPSSSAGAAAIRLLDPSTLSAEVNVSDVDIAAVSVDQPVRLAVESLPTTSFTGKVVSIAPAATVNGNVRTYLVRIAIDDYVGLRSGMRVRATIQRGMAS